MSEEAVFPPGTVLAGRYQVRRELGRGGMGMVYLCRDLALDERVALKLFGRPGEATRPEDAWWFQEEARALAGLNHPAIVRARDFGALPDNTPFLVMDAAPGRSLHEWIYLAQHDGLLPWSVIWSCTDQILAGLAHAHARGVIHGDLKPSNVLLDIPPDGDECRAYILDLGLAWLTQDRVDHRLDGSTEAEPTVRYGAGTPGWMAPEQIRYATPHIGPATDLYALGCILFALVSNREPYTGTNEELLQQHRNAPLPEPGVPPGAPAEIGPFVKKLMAKRPWHRFMYAADARRAWRDFKPEDSATSTPMPRSARPRKDVRSSRNAIMLPEPFAQGEAPRAPPAAGLLALRPSPFVARPEERQRLLRVSHQVAEAFPRRQSDPASRRLVLMTGEAGVGKSRIAEWLCEEVHERGLLTQLRARYRRIPAPLDGVVGAVTQYYRLERADRDVAEKVLMNLWGVDPSDDDGTTWVAATAEWLVPTTAAGKVGPSGKRFALDHPELRWLVMRRTLERIAHDRPILLWMDDIHLAPPGTYENLTRLLKESERLGVLVVATVRNEAVEAEPQNAERLQEMMRGLNAESMNILPLDASQTHELLKETLPLDETAVTEAAARSKGNPLFALQLLHAWAMGGHLEMRDGLYHVPRASLATRASTTADLWEERLQAVPEEFRRAALAAAALGGDIRRDVLRAEYELLGIDAARAIAVLKRAQILLASGTEKLRWPHALMQEHLLTQLFSRPDAGQIFHAAADALGHHPAAQTRRIVRHRVVNLIRANDVVTAADLLHGFIAANWGRSRETAATLRDLALLDGRLDGRPAAVQHLWRGEALRHAGRLEDARREAEAARQMFQELGDRRSEATCLRLLGHIASDQAAPALGRRLVSRGLAIFEEIGDDHGAAQCEVTLGEIDFLLGDHARARQIIASAASRFARAGDRLGYAQSLVVQVFTEQAAGGLPSTRSTILTARREFESIGYRLGMAQCDLTTAHTDHRDGHWDRAREVALAARQSFRDLANPRGEAACERILAMIAIDQDRADQAEEHAGAAALLFDKLADPWGVVEVGLLKAQVALARGDAETAREHLIACEAVALVESEPKQHRHLTKAWLAYHEGRFHEAAKELDAARAAFKDPIRTGDHTPMLLERFAAMGWPKPAGQRLDTWRTILSGAATGKTGRADFSSLPR
ncbi:MAG: protein kinase [Polyangiaceae bacterium]|jgi:serine/threonine protein kinase|nr:protein kinase [Polyangiaceae bacterium]